MSCKNYKSFTESDEKINIGFVSGDFICHPVSYFIHCILQYIDYTKFNVYCYSMKPVNLTERFKNCNWFFVKNKSPEELKQLISSHGIDMLFDLSTHTGDNRLDTFVLKPAPIQISYCGYPNTAGIVSMDKKKFMFYNILSSFLWSFILIFAGHYLYGVFLKQGIDLKHHIEYIIIIIVVISTFPVLLKLLKKRPIEKI